MTRRELMDIFDALDYGIKERCYDVDDAYTPSEVVELEAQSLRWIELRSKINRQLEDQQET